MTPALFIHIRTRFCENAHNLAELIFILNLRTQRSHKRRMSRAVSQIDFRTVFKKQGNDIYKPCPRRAMQRGLTLVIARIYIGAARDQIPDAINTPTAISASLKNNRRPAILCAIRIAIHPAA